jgi:starch synthase
VFQQAVLQWLISFPEQDRPKVLHCHDHHTGLIPFMVKYSPDFRALAETPTVFTIHNGQYQGAFSWRNQHLLPYYYAAAKGYMDWNGAVNPMASAIKCAWAVTTVSESYLFELHENSLGLEPLFRSEWHKQWGIINGIDAQVWDPRTDNALQFRLQDKASTPSIEAIQAFKFRNKQVLCEWFGFPMEAPLVSFIGRMVSEKGSDLLPDAYRGYIHAGGSGSFLVLGTGEAWTQNQFRSMAHQYSGRVNAVIDYNEALAHQIYAGSDFLIMPSRVEPCGLNQMYAMAYGTIPIVRSVGGLKDTVPDIASPGEAGRGIRFDQFSLNDIGYAIHRGAAMWHNEPGIVAALRQRIMSLDFSWEKTVDKYFAVYQKIGASVTPVKEVPIPEKTMATAVAKKPAKAETVKKTASKTTSTEAKPSHETNQGAGKKTTAAGKKTKAKKA